MSFIEGDQEDSGDQLYLQQSFAENVDPCESGGNHLVLACHAYDGNGQLVSALPEVYEGCITFSVQK